MRTVGPGLLYYRRPVLALELEVENDTGAPASSNDFSKLSMDGLTKVP